MKHNTCLSKIALTIFIFLNAHPIFAKVKNSEFFNQATYGSEGPQISEIELEGKTIYTLKYLYKGKEDLVKILSKEEYLKIQSKMNSFFNKKSEMGSDQLCERELVYTKIESESKLSIQKLCWQDITATERLDVSQWISDMQIKFGSKNESTNKKYKKSKATNNFISRSAGQTNLRR